MPIMIFMKMHSMKLNAEGKEWMLRVLNSREVGKITPSRFAQKIIKKKFHLAISFSLLITSFNVGRDSFVIKWRVKRKKVKSIRIIRDVIVDQ